MDFVAQFIILLSKVLIAVSTSVCCYIYLTLNANQFQSLAFPQVTIALVALASFLIATSFFSVFEIGIDTIVLLTRLMYSFYAFWLMWKEMMELKAVLTTCPKDWRG